VAFIHEALVMQEKDSWLNRDSLLALKLVLLIANLSIIALRNPCLTFGFILVYAGLYASIRAWRLLVSTLIMYVPPILVVALLTLFTRGISLYHLNLYLYGYSLILSILLLVSTTRREQLLWLLSKIGLDTVYSLSVNIFEELREMVDSKMARGWEPGINPFKYYVVIIDAIKLTMLRVRDIEEAVMARGLD